MIKLLAIFIGFGISSAQADIYDVPKVTTLQNRLHDYDSELTLQGSYLPMDPFTKYLGVGGSYTYFFSDFSAWEVVNGSLAMPLPAGLRKDLEENFSAKTSQFDILRYHVTTNLSFTPLYTKNLLFNSSLVHSEISFVAGAGIAGFNIGTQGCIDIGIILRYFLGQSFALKFDFRDYIYLSGTRNNLALVLGVAYIFGSKDPEKLEEEFEE